VTKVALSSNPRGDNEQEWIVAAICGQFRILAFARSGDQVWTDIRCPSRCYEDIIYYKGKFFAVDCHGIAVVGARSLFRFSNLFSSHHCVFLTKSLFSELILMKNGMKLAFVAFFEEIVISFSSAFYRLPCL
jgi:hypothetical protein